MRRPQPGEGEGSQADFRDSSLPRFCKAGRTEPEGEPGMRVDFARPLRMTDGGKCYPFERITLSALRCDCPATGDDMGWREGRGTRPNLMSCDFFLNA